MERRKGCCVGAQIPLLNLRSSERSCREKLAYHVTAFREIHHQTTSPPIRSQDSDHGEKVGRAGVEPEKLCGFDGKRFVLCGGHRGVYHFRDWIHPEARGLCTFCRNVMLH